MRASLLLKFTVMTIVGILLTIILLSVLLPVAVVFLVISSTAELLIKLRHGTVSYKARGPDVVNGKESSHSRPIINVAVRVRGVIDMIKIREQTFKTICDTCNENGAKRYKKLLELYCKDFGYNMWRPCETFCIDDHIKEVTIKGVGETNVKVDEVNNDTHNNVKSTNSWGMFMKVFLQEHGMKKFSEERPQWEMLVARNDSETYTILYRFHHAISDGIYLSRMFCEDFLDDPYILFPEHTPPHPIVRLFRCLWSFTLIPYGIWTIMTKNDRNPLHGPELTGKKRFFLSNPINLEEFQRIRTLSRQKVSVHVAVFSCMSYCVSRHFQKKKSGVSTITTLTPLPLQNRTHQIKMKNNFAVAAIDLPIRPKRTSTRKDIEAQDSPFSSAFTRLQAVKESLQKVSEDISLLPTNSLVNGMCSILPTSFAESILSVKGCTACISHLPGAKTETKVYGGTVLDHMFWVPDREPMGIGFSVYSYNGRLRVGLIADDALLHSDQEGEQLMRDFESEFWRLRAEMKTRGTFSLPADVAQV